MRSREGEHRVGGHSLLPTTRRQVPYLSGPWIEIPCCATSFHDISCHRSCADAKSFAFPPIPCLFLSDIFPLSVPIYLSRLLSSLFASLPPFLNLSRFSLLLPNHSPSLSLSLFYSFLFFYSTSDVHSIPARLRGQVDPFFNLYRGDVKLLSDKVMRCITSHDEMHCSTILYNTIQYNTIQLSENITIPQKILCHATR